MRTRHLVSLVILVSLAVPILGVLPPAQFFRFDDFSWLTWASTHGVRDAFDPGRAKETPGGSFRPAYALFWLAGYRTLGPGSAAPWILASACFFAAGLVLLLSWGDSLGPGARHAGAGAVAVWCGAFYPMTYFLLNVFNSGKTTVFFLIPLAVWTGILFYERRRPRNLAISAGAFLVSVLTRESAFAIVPVALAVYILVDRVERGRPWRAFVVYGVLAAVAVSGAALALSPLVRRTLGAIAHDPMPSRWLEGLRYYAQMHFWAGHRRFLWIGLVIIVSLRARKPAFAVAGVLALLCGIFLPTVAPILTVAVLVAVWSARPSKLSTALLAWFVVAFAIVLPTRSRHESYFLEASFPLALFFGMEAGPALARIADRVRRPGPVGAGRRPWRLVAASALGLALLVSAAVVGRRVFDRELLPIKRQGRDFAEANRFLVRTVPVGGRVYVIDENDYGSEMGDYIRRFRRFYLWKGHPESWFAAYGRPDVHVLPWRDEGKPLAPGAYFFASNPYERELFLKGRTAPASGIVFENGLCAVFDLRVPEGAAGGSLQAETGRREP